LRVADAKSASVERLNLDPASFGKLLAENTMASEKLQEGIHAFCTDIEKLEALLIR
jgi:transaldolase